MNDHPIVEVAPNESAQDALDRAAAGTIVQLSPGTHAGPLWISQPGITLRGAGSSHTTIVDLGRTSAIPVPPLHDAAPDVINGIVVYRDAASVGGPSGELDAVRVSGLTIQGFSGAAIYAHTVRGIELEDVQSQGNQVWGMYFRESSHITVKSSASFGAQYAGIGISFCPAAEAVISDCRCSENAFGVFIDNSSRVKLLNISATGNAAGALLMNQVYPGEPPGGVRDCLILGGEFRENGLSAGVTENGLGAAGPPISGVGIALVGTERVDVVGATIVGNQPSGPSVLEGGLTVTSSASFGGSDAVGNRLLWNSLRGNSLGDITGGTVLAQQTIENNMTDSPWEGS